MAKKARSKPKPKPKTKAKTKPRAKARPAARKPAPKVSKPKAKARKPARKPKKPAELQPAVARAAYGPQKVGLDVGAGKYLKPGSYTLSPKDWQISESECDPTTGFASGEAKVVLKAKFERDPDPDPNPDDSSS